MSDPQRDGDDTAPDVCLEAFEKWSKDGGFDLSRTPKGEYIHGTTFCAWEAFQAGVAWKACDDGPA